MPLSEEELRLLEQMERALVEEDPKFASTLRGGSFRRSMRRRALLAAVVFVVGVVILMTGAISSIPLIGIAGFVVMLGSATVGLAALRSRAHPSATGEQGQPDPRDAHPSRQRRTSSGQSFMERLDARWRRRRDGY